MNFALPANRASIVVGASLLTLVILMLFMVSGLWSLRQQYAEEIESVTPRTARMSGFIQSVSQLEEAASRVDQVLEGTAYPNVRDSDTTAASMQQEIREVMATSGLSVSGSQIFPPQAVNGFEQLILDITVTGNINSLDEAIASIGALRPIVIVESMSIKLLPARRSRKSQESEFPTEDQRGLTVGFRLLSLRLLE